MTSRASSDQCSGVKRPFSCQECEIEEGAKQSSGGAEQSSLGERGVLVRREGADKSGNRPADRRVTGIGDVADEPE